MPCERHSLNSGLRSQGVVELRDDHAAKPRPTDELAMTVAEQVLHCQSCCDPVGHDIAGIQIDDGIRTHRAIVDTRDKVEFGDMAQGDIRR